MVYVNGIDLAVNQTFDLNFDLEVNDRLVKMVEDLPELADYHLYKQAGNTVAVPVVSRIAKNIWLALSRVDCGLGSITNSCLKHKN